MLCPPFSKSSVSVRVVVISAAVLSLAACEKKTTAPETTATSASASPAPSSSVIGRYLVPVGPRLAILAGQGVGPIRLGATVATIERLMGAPCEVKTPTLCRYSTRAVEFELGKDGGTVRIHVHRMGRDAGDGKTYGVFNGAIPPDLQLGMTAKAVQEYLGQPESVEQGSKGAAPSTVVQHHYKGMILEYDELPTGRSALGGVRIPD
jgi:hypothetical protein